MSDDPGGARRGRPTDRPRLAGLEHGSPPSRSGGQHRRHHPGDFGEPADSRHRRGRRQQPALCTRAADAGHGCRARQGARCPHRRGGPGAAAAVGRRRFGLQGRALHAALAPRLPAARGPAADRGRWVRRAHGPDRGTLRRRLQHARGASEVPGARRPRPRRVRALGAWPRRLSPHRLCRPRPLISRARQPAPPRAGGRRLLVSHPYDSRAIERAGRLLAR